MAPVAKKTLIIDDLTGEVGARPRTFSLDGVTYEIDLTEASLVELRRALKPYVKAARVTSGGPLRGSSTPRRPGGRAGARGPSQSADIRAWARAVGVAVPARGRIPAAVRVQWQAAGSPT